MEQHAHAGQRQGCTRCGEPLDAVYSGPDGGAFTTCGCGPRPVMQAAPGLFLFAIAASITGAASLLILLR